MYSTLLDGDLYAIGGAVLLPGEVYGGYSVYCLTFADGAQYVGMTGRGILNRLEEHFGGGERGNGIGEIAIVERAALGPWRAEVIATGLSKQNAQDVERSEIKKLPAALNSMRAVTQARQLNDPGLGAVARLLYGSAQDRV